MLQEQVMDSNSYFNLASPPRQIPPLVWAQVLFGGFINQFGWGFFGFGLIFLWAFGLNTDLTQLLFALRPVETAPGVILSVESTSATVNETPVYAYSYAFRIEQQETEYRSQSYSTGRQFESGWDVTVEYLADSPDMSRIHGTRRGVFSPWVLAIVLPFPLVGLGFIIAGVVNGIAGLRLLSRGRMTVGKLSGKEPTSTRINHQPVYKLTFDFVGDDGMPQTAVAKTHKPYRLEDEAEERLLYDPRQPDRAVLLDNLPGSPEIDPFGQLYSTNVKGAMLSLLLPGLVIIGHGVALAVVIMVKV
jgi:hypothetical protein